MGMQWSMWSSQHQAETLARRYTVHYPSLPYSSSAYNTCKARRMQGDARACMTSDGTESEVFSDDVAEDRSRRMNCVKSCTFSSDGQRFKVHIDSDPKANQLFLEV